MDVVVGTDANNTLDGTPAGTEFGRDDLISGRDGNDTLNAYDNTGTERDRIVIDSSVAMQDVRLTADTYHIYLHVGDSTKVELTYANYDRSVYRFGDLVMPDGSIIDLAGGLPLTGTENNDTSDLTGTPGWTTAVSKVYGWGGKAYGFDQTLKESSYALDLGYKFPGGKLKDASINLHYTHYNNKTDLPSWVGFKNAFQDERDVKFIVILPWTP